jgi:hypothetical protein
MVLGPKYNIYSLAYMSCMGAVVYAVAFADWEFVQ